MTRETIRRRRGPSPTASTSNSSSNQRSRNATVAASSSNDSPAEISYPKSVDQIVEEENKSFTQFLSLCGIVTLVFLYMIRTTELPSPRRVFVVMLDAGSTGTRAQIFQFIHDKDENRLVLKGTKMHTIQKSIAALGAGVGGTGSQFFKPLLDEAKKGVIGVRRRRRTPIVLYATAGLRLLGPEAAELALDKARTALNASEFLLNENYVSILSARDEAIHGWTTINYLLGNLGVASKRPQVATLELGGASMQIAHVATDANSGSLTNVHMFGVDYKLHAVSHLGLGLFGFTDKLFRTFDAEGILEEGNPCFRKGKVFAGKTLRLGVEGSEEKHEVTIVGDGDFQRCVASANIVIASSVDEAKNGLSKLPPDTVAYAFAYFYDRTVGLGLSKEPSKDELWIKGKELCESGPDHVITGDFDEACAEFAYVYSVITMLTDDFSKDRGVKVKFEQYLEGHMVGWALGASLEVAQQVMEKQISLDNESLIIS